MKRALLIKKVLVFLGITSILELQLIINKLK